MRRAKLLIGVAMALGAPDAGAQGGLVTWNRLDVVTRLDRHGRAEVSETHEMKIQGDVSVINRDLNFGAGQSALIHGVFQLEPDGSKKPLKAGPVSEGDSYQAWTWGLQFSLRGEKEPPFDLGVRTRTYVIEYSLSGALSPAWDLAAGSAPLDAGTQPRNPWSRAGEVWRGWREAWPELRKTYRFDHDVVLPSRGSTDSLIELNYRLEYDDAWVLLDQNRPVGVATPDVDYRVQRLLRYLPEGAPKEVSPEGAALRLTALLAPLVLGLLAGLLFLGVDRLSSPAPRGDRALFESRIAPMAPESIAARFGESTAAPSFGKLLERMATEKRISITVEAPETDEADALVRLRLTVDRARLSGFEREVVQELFGASDAVATPEIQHRHRGEEFDPDLLVGAAFDRALPRRVVKRRPLLSALHLGSMAGGVVLMIRCLVDQTLADPAPLLAGIVPGNALSSYWPAGSSLRRPSAFSTLFAIVVLGLLGAALALIPNTPLSGPVSLGLALLGTGHVIGYLARLPKSTPEDLEFEAARRWALRELGRPRPDLKDAWVEALEALGARRALARWRSRYGGGGFQSAPDMSELGLVQAVAGPAFTGERPPPPALPARWAAGFSTFEGDEGDEGAEDD